MVLFGVAAVTLALTILVVSVLKHVERMERVDPGPVAHKRAILEARRKVLISVQDNAALSEERKVAAADLRRVDAALVRLASDDTAELEDVSEPEKRPFGVRAGRGKVR
jgi:hypothetical protein